MTPDELPHLLTIPELATHLGTGVRHVRRLVQERRVPYLKVGRFVRFDPDEIDRWLDDYRVAGPVQKAGWAEPPRSNPRGASDGAV
jgi:excisionase family DNA binding protein